MNFSEIQEKEDLIQVSDSLHQFSAEEFNAIVKYIKTLGDAVFAEPHDYFDIVSGMEGEATNIFVNTSLPEATLSFLPRYRRSQIDISGNPIIKPVSGNEDATIVVKDSNLNVEATYTVRAIYNETNQKNIPELLSAGTHYVDITISPSGVDSQTLQFVVTSTSLGIQIADNCNWHLPWKQYTRYLLGPYIITGSLDKTFHLRTKCGSYVKEKTVNLGTDTYVEIPYVYEASSSEFPGSTGEIEVEAWLTAGQIETQHVKYNVAGIRSGDNKSARVFVKNNVIASVSNGQTSNVFDYCVYYCGNANANIKTEEVITDNEEVVYNDRFTETVSCETKLQYSRQFDIDSDSPDMLAQFKLGFLSDWSYDTTITLPVNNSSAMPYVRGAEFVMSPSKKSNGDPSQTISNAAGSGLWSYTYQNMQFVDGMDGWTLVDGRKALVVPAGEKITFDKNMFRNVNTLSAKVIDITYKTTNVSNYNAPIITMCDNPAANDFVGLKITPSKVVLHSNYKNRAADDYMQGTNLPDEQEINIQVCLCPNYNTSYGNFAFIYVNGVKKVTFSYNGDSFATNDGSIVIGSDYADTYIYSIKEYNTSFSFSNVLTNYYSSLDGNLVNRQAYKQFDDNVIDSTGSGVSVSYEKIALLSGAAARNYFVISLDDESSLPKHGKDKLYKHMCDLEMHYSDGYAFKLTDQYIEGQGTTSMNYWLWNFRWRIDKNPNKTCGVAYSSDHGLTWSNQGQQGSIEFASGKTGVKRITAKKNYASSMQSHKIGSTRAYNDLHDAVVGQNEAEARVSVYQYPAYGFIKIPTETPGRYVYKFVGLYTIGPDKGDKHTFGYDNSTYKNTYALLEGLDHNTALTLFKYPWNSLVQAYAHDGDLDIAINLQNNNYQRGWEVSALCGLETDNREGEYNSSAIKSALEACWKPAYEVAYLNNPFIKSVDETGYVSIAAINSDYSNFSRQVDSDHRPFTHFELYDENYDLYYFDLCQNQYVASEVNVKSDVQSIIDVILPELYNDGVFPTLTFNELTTPQKTELFIRARVKRFRDNVGKYWNVNDCLFHQQFCFIIAATDNDAKNTYPYSFNPTIQNGETVCKWRWKQDDLDTIFDIDNQGVPMKKYSVERSDFSNDEKTAYVFKGEDSVFWTLLSLAYDTYDPNKTAEVMGRSILNAMCNLSSGITYEEKLMNFFKTYYWDNAQNYFARSAYNVDAKISYEDASVNSTYTSGVDVNPLEQSLGNHEEAEKDWVNKRIIYCMSKYKFGPFGNYENTDAGRILIRTQIAQSFELTPAMDLYPTVISGQNSDIRKPLYRISSGDTYTTDSLGGNNTQITIPAADYLLDIGDLKGLMVDSASNVELKVKSKRLRRVKIGDANPNLVTTSIKTLALYECPQLLEIDARNLEPLTGTIDLTYCGRIQSCLLENTSVSLIVAKNAVNLQYLQLPSTIARITVTNTPKLNSQNINIDDGSNLEYIWVENTSLGLLDEVFRNWSTTSNVEDVKTRGVRMINVHDPVRRSSLNVTRLKTIHTLYNVMSIVRNCYGIDSQGLENTELFPVITGVATIDNEGDRQNSMFPSDVTEMKTMFNDLEFDGHVALFDTDSDRPVYAMLKRAMSGRYGGSPLDYAVLYSTDFSEFDDDDVLVTNFGGTDTFDEFKYFTGITKVSAKNVHSMMTAITFPRSISSFDRYVFSHPFEHLTWVDIDEENPTFSSNVTATLFDGSKEIRNNHDTIVEKETNRTVFTVGDRITKQTTTVEPYTAIGNKSGIYNVFEEGVTTIAPMAIDRDASVIVLPSTINRIYSCFSTHDNAEYVICFSENPPAIDQRSVYFWSEHGHPNALNDPKQHFLGESENLKILVPVGCAEAYKQANSWSAYADKIYDFGEYAQLDNVTLDSLMLILEAMYNA